MRILAIETSCDETGAAVVERKGGEQFVKVLSNVTATSSSLHAKTGEIIPEFAAREQIKAIIPVIIQALLEAENNHVTMQPFNHFYKRDKAKLSFGNKFKYANHILTSIDAIAVTHGPGLIGSLLVGVETAKTLSFVLNKPIIPVHHLLAHLYANFILDETPEKRKGAKLFHPPGGLGSHLLFKHPFIGLIVSGGHTDLLYFESHSKYKWLGGTRDDAAGEALDKVGRILGFPYPAGPEIEQKAAKIQKLTAKSQLPTAKFQSPLINSEDFDFSFSGLKTEVSRFVSEHDPEQKLSEKLINEICYALQKAIFAVLIKKTIRAAKLYKISTILLGGGVSANQTLREQFEQSIINNKLSMQIFSPLKEFATDNGAMIGAYALLNYKPVPWKRIKAQPELYFD